MNKEIKTKTEIDFIQWLTCPHCKKIIFQGSPEMIGWLLKWKKQSDKKIKKILKKKINKGRGKNK